MLTPLRLPKMLGIALAMAVLIASRTNAGFTIRDLGAFANAGTSQATAINASGEATGMATSSKGGIVAAMWTGAGHAQPVSVPAGATTSMATSINSGGQIAGNYTDANGLQHGFYTSGGQAGTIKNLSIGSNQGTWTQAGGMNDSGQIAGTGNVANVGTRAFTTTGSATPTIINPLGTGTFDQGAGINAGGQVVGTSQISPGGQLRAFYTDGGSQAKDLLARNTQGDFYSNTYGNAIAKNGDVVGYGDVGGSEHAFYASSTPQTSLVDLGVLSGTSTSAAESVNSSALVVGGSGASVTQLGQTGSLAFLWGSPEGLYNLNSLISTADQQNWVLTEATGINDSDQISGMGYVGGILHGFVLTPIAGQSIFDQVGTVPTPTALLLSAMGLGIASTWGRLSTFRPGRIAAREAS